MNYNTTRSDVNMREYGRHIQKLVDFAILIEDNTERQKTAESIIQLMTILNPHLKSVIDYRHKLWDHLFIISDFKLDVNAPYPKITQENARIQPSKMLYPRKNIRLKHYGKNVESMVQKAVNMDDTDKKEAFTEIIGNFMKMAYKNWSNEEVSNDLIKADMKTLSKGLLEISEEMDIETMTRIQRKREMTNTNNNRNNNNRNNNRNNNNRNNNNRSNYSNNNNNNRFKK